MFERNSSIRPVREHKCGILTFNISSFLFAHFEKHQRTESSNICVCVCVCDVITKDTLSCGELAESWCAILCGMKVMWQISVHTHPTVRTLAHTLEHRRARTQYNVSQDCLDVHLLCWWAMELSSIFSSCWFFIIYTHKLLTIHNTEPH